MTLVPNPVLARDLARARQVRFQATAPRRPARHAQLALRIRLGRMLMSAGASISGDCIELPSRRTAAGRTA